MYDVNFDDEALDFLEESEKSLKKRIWKKIMSTKEDPHRFFIRLKERDDYKLRVGDYRVIADINNHNKKIQINLIGHRKNIYKK